MATLLDGCFQSMLGQRLPSRSPASSRDLILERGLDRCGGLFLHCREDGLMDVHAERRHLRGPTLPRRPSGERRGFSKIARAKKAGSRPGSHAEQTIGLGVSDRRRPTEANDPYGPLGGRGMPDEALMS